MRYVIRSCSGDLLLQSFLVINWISAGEVCWIGSDIERVWYIDDSTWDKLAVSSISGCGVNLVSRLEANKLTFSR